MPFLVASTEPRDIENHGSRFWILYDLDTSDQIFGNNTVGIVDEVEGGTILVTHDSHAARLVEIIRAAIGEI